MITETDINAIASRIETVLRDIAVPKPSRAAEHYAALTLSIVLLQEHIETLGPETSARHACAEIQRLSAMRTALEEQFESDDEIAGGGA